MLLATTARAADTISPASPYQRTSPLAIHGVRPSAREVAQYDRLDLTVDLSATYTNPFDPAQVALEARVRAPSGRQFTQPGFYDQPFRRELRGQQEILSPDGPPRWRVRLSFTETGEHLIDVRARDASGSVQAEPLRVRVTAAASGGFVRVSRRDPRYFEFPDSRPMFPIGANVCWAGSRGTFDYDDWLAAYAAAGANYFRLWLSPHWTTFALEQVGTPAQGKGLGWMNLANAWRLDYVLGLAARHGLWVKLCIDSYNVLREKNAYPQWDNSPHNARHGGPLQHPAQFWTNAIMDRLYQQKLCYLVARYAAHPRVFAWEFWNEADITTGYATAAARQWHQRMARRLRALDPYGHLLTTSFAHTPGDPEVDRLPELDYVQTHHYGSADLCVTLARAQADKAAYHKPHYVGEIGADAGGPRREDDPGGLQVHDPLWVSVVTGGAGAAQSWWWDNLIHPQRLYPLFTPLVRFTADVNWPAEQFHRVEPRVEWPDGSASKPPKVPVRAPAADEAHPPVLAWAIAGQTTALAWARVQGRTWQAVCARKQTVPPSPPCVLVLPGLPPGEWAAELWDTWGQGVIQTQRVRSSGSGEVRLRLPEMERDLAVKLRRR